MMMTTTRMTIMIIVPKAPVVMEEMGVLVAPADAAATDHPAKAETEVMEAMGVTEVLAVPVTLAEAAQEATEAMEAMEDLVAPAAPAALVAQEATGATEAMEDLVAPAPLVAQEAMGATEAMEDMVAPEALVAQEATVDPAETVDAEATGPLAEVAAEETEVMGVMEAKEVLQIEAPCHQVPARLQLGVQSLQVQPRTKTLRSCRTHPL